MYSCWLNSWFCKQTLPNQWSILNLSSQNPESGDLSLTTNYRVVSLNSVVIHSSLIAFFAKTYSRMLLNRIRLYHDDKLRPNQCGFTENWEELRRIIEGIGDKNLSAVVTFIDFKKAFDTIFRCKMIKILEAYSIPDIIIHANEDTYQDTKTTVTTSDGDPNEFDILTGVLQGGTLAPYLFIIVLDYYLRSAIEGKEESKNNDLDFADDIALLSDTAAQAQELLSNVENAALCVGLHMNAMKTQFMVHNQPTRVEIHTVDDSCLVEWKTSNTWGRGFGALCKTSKSEKWWSGRHVTNWQKYGHPPYQETSKQNCSMPLLRMGVFIFSDSFHEWKLGED